MINDGFVEGLETFSITLSHPMGGALSTPSTVTITIIDNDFGSPPNPVDNASCIELKRINVSAAFFLSIEFQETGYLVYRTYKTSFGNLAGKPVPVRYLEFLRSSTETLSTRRW